MRKFLLLNTILFLSLFSTAQVNDALEEKLNSISIPTEKVDLIIDWSNKNYKNSPEEAKYYLHKSLHLSSEISYYTGKGLSLMRLGTIEKKYNNNTVALQFYNDAIQNFKLTNDSLNLYKTLFNRSNLYRIQESFDLATNDLYQCLDYFERKKEAKLCTYSHNGIGLIFKHLKKYDKALAHYKKAIKIIEDNNLKSSYYSANTNIANILSIQDKFQEALQYYKKNLDLLKEKPNKYKQAQTFHNIGSCYLEMIQYPLAVEYLHQSLELKEEIGNKNLIISTLNSLSHIYYQQNSYKKALEYSKRALKLAEETKNIEYQKNCNEELFRIFTHLHLEERAILHFYHYKSLRDSIFNHENLKQIAEIQEKYESEKKATQITLLEKENKSKMWQRNSLMVLLILLLGYAIFIVRSYYRDKKTNRLLQIQNKRIQWHKALLDKKNEALLDSNKTKNRLFQIISHDLRAPLASVHNISQLIKIFVQQKRYNKLEESTNDMEGCINNVLSLTDNLLSWSLNQAGKLPYKPIILSLKPLLKNNIQTYTSIAKQKNIHLQLILDETFFVFADRKMLETVVRNLINNSLKFTPSGGVIVVGAQQKDDFTEVWIKDSGIGISKDQIAHLFELENAHSSIGTKGEQGNGLGLLLCKQFIEQNKGEIWVESTTNVGTTFRFTIPSAENTNEITSILTSELASN